MNTSSTLPSSVDSTHKTNPNPTPRAPRYSVEPQENRVLLRVELPAVPRESLRIEFEDQTLTLQAQPQRPQAEGWQKLHSEISQRPYQLRLRFQMPVVEDGAQARLEDGVLWLTLPLQAKAQPRQIPVN